MLPIDYIQPCLRAIGYVTKYLNSTAILMSATMPNYDKFMESVYGYFFWGFCYFFLSYVHWAFVRVDRKTRSNSYSNCGNVLF